MLHSGSILVACEKPRGVLVRELLRLKLGWFDPDQVHTRPLTLPVYEPAYRIKHEALLPARFFVIVFFCVIKTHVGKFNSANCKEMPHMCTGQFI